MIDGSILVDYNEAKLVDGREIWTDISLLNPFDLRPTWMERAALLLSLGLRDTSRRALQAVGLATTVMANSQANTSFYLWNPYSMFHFGIDEVLGADEVAIFTPEYPLPRRCRVVVAPEVVQQIYGIPDRAFRSIEIPHQYVRDKPILAIYLTSSEESEVGWKAWAEHRQIQRIESRIIDFGLQMARRGVAVEFFLHYSERSVEKHFDRAEEFLKLVNFGDSLQTLSTQQISLCGASTIAFKLASIGVPHAFALVTSDGEWTPYTEWASVQPNLLEVDGTDEEWVGVLRRCFPSISDVVFGSALGRES